jgi:hypothetical protein
VLWCGRRCKIRAKFRRQRLELVMTLEGEGKTHEGC